MLPKLVLCFTLCLRRQQGERGDKGLLRSFSLMRRETEARSVLRVAFSYGSSVLSWNSCPQSFPPLCRALPPSLRHLVRKEIAVEAQARVARFIPANLTLPRRASIEISSTLEFGLSFEDAC